MQPDPSDSTGPCMICARDDVKIAVFKRLSRFAGGDLPMLHPSREFHADLLACPGHAQYVRRIRSIDRTAAGVAHKFRSGGEKTTPSFSFVVSQHTYRRFPDGLRRLRQRLARAKLNHALPGPETLIPVFARHDGPVR